MPDPSILLALASAPAGLAAGAWHGRRAAKARGDGFRSTLRDELVQQAADLDRLIAALGGLADGRDESLVLARACRDARRLVDASAAVLLEPMADGTLRAVEVAGVELDRLDAVEARDADGALRAVRAALAMPSGIALLLEAQHDTVGVLVIVDDDPDALVAPALLSQLRVIADFAARAAQNARLNRHLERMRDEAEERERERARLSNRLLHAEHEERRRLAASLHDGPQQTVAGVALMLDSLLDHLEHGGTVADVERLVRIARDHSKEVVRELREASLLLEPRALRDEGLAAALLPLADRLAEAHGVRFRIDVDAAESLDEDARALVFRVLREAIANAVKHARPSTVAVSARALGDELEVTVLDDGCGMPALAVTSEDGLGQGTAGMRERAAPSAARSSGGRPISAARRSRS